jgi:hypothetical protein
MSEEPNMELTPAEAGAEAAPVAGDGAGEVAAVSQPAQEPIAGEVQEAPQVDLSKIDLTTLPQFREVQSSFDRQAQSLRQRAEQAERRAAEQARRVEQQMAEIRMKDATPNEQAAYYRTELARQQVEREQEKRQMAETARLQAEAGKLVADLGLDINTPGLDWSAGATPQGLARLATSAARLVADREKKRQEEAVRKTAKAKKTATQQAVRATGAATPNLATGSTNKGLMAEYQAELAKLRGTGKTYEFQKLQRAYRAKGLSI